MYVGIMIILTKIYLQRSALVNFVAAVAYHICLALPVAFTKTGDRLSAEPCMWHTQRI